MNSLGNPGPAGFQDGGVPGGLRKERELRLREGFARESVCVCVRERKREREREGAIKTEVDGEKEAG